MADLELLPSPPVDRSAAFLEPAPLIDVLFDQLEYLISHTEQECLPGCSDCERLEEVKKLLLAPFASRDANEAREPVAA